MDYGLTGWPRYDQIRDLYTSQLASVLIRGDSIETTRASFDRKIDSFTEGELEHATEMLSTLWRIVKKPGITAPSNSPATESVPALPSLVLHGGAHTTPQVRSGSHKSRKLGSCGDRPHQVDPRRGFL